MTKSKLKIVLRINYLISQNIIMPTPMVANEKRAEVKAETERDGLFSFLFVWLNNTDITITLLRMP